MKTVSLEYTRYKKLLPSKNLNTLLINNMEISPWIIHTLHSWFNKAWVFDFNPEFWHKLIMQHANSAEKVHFILENLQESLYLEDPSLETQVWNMTFKNPVWLAAWFAKQSHWLKFLEACWFGYLTIWWITHSAQSWNEKPRIFRFGNDIVNGMWLPWDGVENEVKRLAKRKELWLMPNIPIIANLCNSLLTPANEKTEEFLYLMQQLYPYVDGFEINVSCPNQCWVTSMQQEQVLKELLTKVENYNKKLALKFWIERKTLLVKIAPLSKNEFENNWKPIKDLTLSWLEIIANVCNDVWIDWVTATNTSQEHEYDTKIIKPDGWIISWWLSWLWLHKESLRTVKELRKKLDKTIPIIWVWWIWYDMPIKTRFWWSWIDMITAWATSVEVMSSFVQKSVVVPYYLKKTVFEWINI